MNEEIHPFTVHIRISDEEKNSWSSHAKTYFRGNLSRMIRTIINQSIVNHSDSDDFSDQLDEEVETMRKTSFETFDKISSLESDLQIIKTLLSKLLQKQSESISKYQSSSGLPVEDLVYQRVFEYVRSQERMISADEVISYLLKSCVECRRYLAAEEQKIPGGSRIAIAFILEEVIGELGLEDDQGGNIYDF
ncbi:MAG: hypothetical protein INQ03_24760 [Candidatus Heimdallarchaeota archaeon]|nr:hypothetical protein [Candidatus Heimdallarchaeota archaeon]